MPRPRGLSSAASAAVVGAYRDANQTAAVAIQWNRFNEFLALNRDQQQSVGRSYVYHLQLQDIASYTNC